jgi:hypothetical protein
VEAEVAAGGLGDRNVKSWVWCRRARTIQKSRITTRLGKLRQYREKEVIGYCARCGKVRASGVIAQTDLVTLLSSLSPPSYSPIAASFRSKRCIVIASESSSDRRKYGVCVKVSHGQLVSARVGQANDATFYISPSKHRDFT